MRRVCKGLVPLVVVMAILAAAGCAGKQAARYPTQPITVIAPAGPGSGWDMTARTVTQVLTDEKLVPVAMPVENRAGGGGAVALSHVVQNKKGDAYTLVVYSPPLLLINLTGQTKLGYKDLTPIARLFCDYQFIGVKKDSKFQNLTQVFDALKADPKSVTVAGASSPGSMDHLSFMMAAQKAGVDIKQVQYLSFQGGAELTAAVLGGNVDVISSSVGDVLGQLEAGTIRGLAVMSPQRYADPRVAGTPTLIEQGIEATFEVWRGIFGPPDMPAEAKEYVSSAIEKMVQTEAWKNALKKYNWQAAYLNAQDFTAFLDKQGELLGGLLKTMGLIK